MHSFKWCRARNNWGKNLYDYKIVAANRIVPMYIQYESVLLQLTMCTKFVRLRQLMYFTIILFVFPFPACSFSTGTGFIFEDQFLQISALLPSSNIYGLGEHTTRLRLPTNITLTMFSQDTPPLPSVSVEGVGVKESN